MSVSTPAPAGPVRPSLTDHDMVVNAKSRRAVLPASDTPLQLSVAVSPRPQTPILARIYPTEQRIVLSLGTSRTDLVLFLPVDQLDRLINVLTTARERLHGH